ncbi:DUF2240 family protein [Salinarchaeum chitinilyticum]
MDLRRTVAAPFRQRGVDELGESEFVAAIAMDRRWYSPAQSKRLLDVAAGEGLIERADDVVKPTFDVGETTIPEEFSPGEDLLQDRSTFERVLDVLTEAGHEKRDVVAGINQLQGDLGVTIEAAAVVYARKQGEPVADIAERAIGELDGGD